MKTNPNFRYMVLSVHITLVQLGICSKAQVAGLQLWVYLDSFCLNFMLFINNWKFEKLRIHGTIFTRHAL